MRIRNLFGAFFAALIAAICLPSFAAIPASEQVQVIEYYHSGLDHFFITTDSKEISDLDTGVHPGWVRTGYQFPAIKIGSTLAGTVPMCRFYASKWSTHFFTSKPAECQDVKNKFADTWTFESGEVFRAFPVDGQGSCPADTTAVSRLWNQREDVNHRYTDQLSVFLFMVAKGYKAEGDGNTAFPVVFCVPTPGSVVPPAAPKAPSCTVTASSGTPALGSTLNLNAVCTNNPTNFMWTNCASSTSACSTTQNVAGQKSYTLYSSNAAGPGDPVTISVTWGGGGGGGGAVPICTISANTVTPSVGTTLSLSASCSQAPTKYNWVECDVLIQQLCNALPSCPTSVATCQVTKGNASPSRYAVSGENASGAGPRVGLDVDWKSSGGGGGGGGNDPIPTCTMYTSNSSPFVNQTITLTAACTGNPTGYAWTGLSCASAQCPATSTSPGPVTYTVVASNAAGSSNVSTMTIDWKSTGGGGGGGGGGTVPSCSLSASPATPSVGQQVTITSSCTNNPTTFVWAGCASNTATCTDIVNVAGPKQYQLTASNGSGAGSPVTISVDWQSSGSSAPVCSISSSSTQPATGQNITLTANCSGAPTSYTWTNCSSATSTCVTTSNAVGSQTYYVSGTNANGTGNVVGVTVNWVAPTNNPPSCTIAASSQSPQINTTISLTATCSGNPTSYNWTNCSSTGPTCQATSGAAGATTYYVAGVNQYGTGTPAGVVVNWQSGGGGGGGGGDFCGQYSGVQRISVDWGDISRQFTSGFYDNVVVMSFTVPTSPSSYASAGRTSMAEYGDEPALRQMTLSKSACDFRAPDPTGANGPITVSYGTTVTVDWNVGTSPLRLVPGQTYYWSFRNYSPDSGLTCAPRGPGNPNGVCEAAIVTLWPF